MNDERELFIKYSLIYLLCLDCYLLIFILTSRQLHPHNRDRLNSSYISNE